MKKVSVTYHAPKGDSKVVEIWGHVFYDGKAEEIEVDDDTLKTIKGNRFFECGAEADIQPGGQPAHEPKDHREHRGR
jgi:hypothetical protein